MRALGRYPKVLGVDFPITVQVEDAHVVLRARARRRRFAAQVLRGRLHDGSRLPSRQQWMNAVGLGSLNSCLRDSVCARFGGAASVLSSHREAFDHQVS